LDDNYFAYGFWTAAEGMQLGKSSVALFMDVDEKAGFWRAGAVEDLDQSYMFMDVLKNFWVFSRRKYE
jgi:hypothetical protein